MKVMYLYSLIYIQGRSWPGGSRGPDPPASFKFTFSNDPNPMSFLLGVEGGGKGGGGG